MNIFAFLLSDLLFTLSIAARDAFERITIAFEFEFNLNRGEHADLLCLMIKKIV